MGHWRLHTNLDFRWEDWGNQWSLYQASSSETHFLNPLGAVILTYLASHPRSGLKQIHEQVCMEFDGAPPRDLRAQIAASLMRFDELGLIQRQPQDDPAA